MKKPNQITASLFLAFVLVGFSPEINAQGCMPARHIPPNLGIQGLSYLVNGQWEAGLSYRYLFSNSIYVGTTEIEAAKNVARMKGHTFNLFGRYAVNHRISIILNVPISYIEESFPHDDGLQHTMYPGVQLGDIRLSANYWLLDPLTAKKGNVAVGIGLKLPSGKHDVTTQYYLANGSTEERHLDIALQPGDGGWGIILEATWIQNYSEIFSSYFNGSYIINPKNMNSAYQPLWYPPGTATNSSVPDQFNLRAGLSATVSSFAYSLGVRYDGMPLHDLIGDSNGFRRPGHIVYIEPGVMWSNIINTVNLFVPVAVHRNIRTNEFDESQGIETDGGFADFLIVLGYTRRF